MKRIGIIGAGRFGSSLAEYLAEQGAEIVLVERTRDLVQKMSSIATKAVLGDATDVEVLKEAGIKDCDIAVVAIGTQIEGSILATMNLKELKLPYIVAKAGTDIHGKVLERIGADLVVYPNKERAQRPPTILSQSLVSFARPRSAMVSGLVRSKTNELIDTLTMQMPRNTHAHSQLSRLAARKRISA